MAWRPTQHLIEGQLDNTTLGKVTGWMRFAGMKETVTFDLQGDFHRDIRGAKIQFRGEGFDDHADAAGYMEGFSTRQLGDVGDITAGLPPQDYSKYPYIEWYSEENGRVVLELAPDQVKVIGRPIPACESDPISREKQAQNMGKFLVGLSMATGVAAAAVGPEVIVSYPSFTHWVMEEGRIVGEAHSIKPVGNGTRFAFVRLFAMPEMAEYGYIEANRLVDKQERGRR